MMQRMDMLRVKPFTVTIAIIIFILLLNLLFDFEQIVTWKPFEELNIASQFTVLIFASVAIESLSEIFISNFRQDKKARIQKEIETIKAKLENEEQELSDKEKELLYHRNRTKVWCNLFGLSVGCLVGLGGVRIIQPLVVEPDLTHWQLSLFNTVDILLTAALLSEGSSNIHRLTSLYKKFTTLAEDRVQQR